MVTLRPLLQSTITPLVNEVPVLEPTGTPLAAEVSVLEPTGTLLHVVTEVPVLVLEPP